MACDASLYLPDGMAWHGVVVHIRKQARTRQRGPRSQEVVCVVWDVGRDEGGKVREGQGREAGKGEGG